MQTIKQYSGPLNYLAGALTVFAVIGVFNLAHQPSNPHQSVYTTCMDSRLVLDGAKEEACGALQDKHNVEFLCDGIEASSHCWTEDKVHAL